MKDLGIKLSLSFLFSLVFNATEAQINVQDIEHKKKIEENVKRDARQIIQFETMEEISNEALDRIAAIRELQFAIQEALKKVESVKDLQWGNIDFFLKKIVALSDDPDDYISNIPYCDRLKQLYTQIDKPMDFGQEMYSLLVSLDTEVPYPEEWAVLNQKMFEESISHFAFLEFADKRKVHIALVYQQLSDIKVLKAAEISDVLITAEKFSMTEADRIRILKYADEYVQESYRLKLKADRLINELQNPPEIKREALKGFHNKLYRQSLAEFPQQKFD